MIDILQPNVDAITSNPLFDIFALPFIFLYASTPSIVFVPTEVFMTPLLQKGISPVTLIIVSAFGGLLGDLWVYGIGRFSHRALTGKTREIADAKHFLLRFKRVAFFFPPLTGSFGDVIMLFAGFRRLGFFRLAPFLLVGQFVRYSLGVASLLGILEIPEFFGI